MFWRCFGKIQKTNKDSLREPLPTKEVEIVKRRDFSNILEMLSNDAPTDKINEDNRIEIIQEIELFIKENIELDEKQALNLKKLAMLFDIKISEVEF